MIGILEVFFNLFARLATPLTIFTTLFSGYQFILVSYELHKEKNKKEGSFFYLGIIQYIVLLYILFQSKGLEEIISPGRVSLLYFGLAFFWWITSLAVEKFLPTKQVIDWPLHKTDGFIARFLFYLGVLLIILKIILIYV